MQEQYQYHPHEEGYVDWAFTSHVCGSIHVLHPQPLPKKKNFKKKTGRDMADRYVPLPSQQPGPQQFRKDFIAQYISVYIYLLYHPTGHVTSWTFILFWAFSTCTGQSSFGVQFFFTAFLALRHDFQILGRCHVGTWS